MNARHKVRITNTEGEAVFTQVELDGVQQYVSGFAIDGNVTKSLDVRLFYPYVAVEVQIDNAKVQRSYHAKLFIPGYDGVTSHGYGDTIPAALRDMATRLETGQS